MKKKQILWGVIFLICAVLLIVDKLVGLGGISVFDLIFGALFVAMFLNGIANISFGEILFSLAFLAILFDRELGITDLTPWTVLIVALLGTIGLNLIFGKKKKSYQHQHYDTAGAYDHTATDNMQTDHTSAGGTHFTSETNFSSSVKYIHADHFQSGQIECNFGACEVFFDNTEGYQGNGILNLEANFGKITVYVPQHWIVVNNTVSSFGNSSMKRSSPDAGPVLHITGEANFGAIEIRNA